MNEFITIKLDGTTPLLATAIHNGNLISKDLSRRFALDESDQLREEDPFTWIWTGISENRIASNLI